MCVIRGIATSGLAVFLASVFLAVTSEFGIAQASEALVTPPEDVLTYATTGCGGAIVQTPWPGEQFSAASLGLPDSVELFYAKAARLNVTWLLSMNCTHTHRSHALTPSTVSAAPSQTPA